MSADITAIRAIRNRYDETLQKMRGKSVLGFHIENHPLLWNLTALAAHRAATASGVADIVLGNLSAPHALRINNKVFVGMADYPDEYNPNEFELWMTCQNTPTASDPIPLTDYLDLRIGTPATYAVVTAFVLRCVGTVGAVQLQYVEDDLNADAGERKVAQAWVRVTDTGEVLDLFARATGRSSESGNPNAIVRSLNF